MAVKAITIAINDQITSTTATAPDVVFTSTDGQTLINAATIMNTSASSITVTFQLLPTGVSASSTNHCWTQTIAAGATEIVSGLIGRSIPNLGTLNAYAGTTNVLYFSANGTSIV